MNDFSSFEKSIVRELSCRLCLSTEVVNLKPLSAEVKRKIKKLFHITVRPDDTLPKAICHDCLQQVSALHLYSVKVEKTQKFLDFHKLKSEEEKQSLPDTKMKAIVSETSTENIKPAENAIQDKKKDTPPKENVERQGDTEIQTKKSATKSKESKHMESMPIEEFAKTEKLDKSMLNATSRALQQKYGVVIPEKKEVVQKRSEVREVHNDVLDTVVIVDGKPAKQGQALDKQITLFYKMECCICHQGGFHFRSLMKHYKERHGVPGYVTCCDKKFHYFYPKKIIEHMAYHLQPSIFMCPSCHQNFHSSRELMEHQANGGRTDGKIQCPRCSERFPTYHELGWHLVTHRTDKMQCDYCGKQLKHQHRKKTINRMEDIVLCSQCVRTLRAIEKQEKELKDQNKAKSIEILQKHRKFGQAMGLSGDEDASTD